MVNLESFGLDQLGHEGKLLLAGQLWDSVFATEAPGAFLSNSQREELQRCLGEYAQEAFPMIFPVRLRRAAQIEYDEAADWYASRRTGLGVRFAPNLK